LRLPSTESGKSAPSKGRHATGFSDWPGGFAWQPTSSCA
jgi:hypothetical protein